MEAKEGVKPASVQGCLNPRSMYPFSGRKGVSKSLFHVYSTLGMVLCPWSRLLYAPGTGGISVRSLFRLDSPIKALRVVRIFRGRHESWHLLVVHMPSARLRAKGLESTTPRLVSQLQQQETRKPLREQAQPWSGAHQRAERRSGQLHSRAMTTSASQVCSAGSST